MAQRAHVVVDSADPFERGRQRGAQVSAGIAASWPIYQAIFDVTAREAGRDRVDASAISAACLDAVSAWSPLLLRELEGVAAGADLPLTTVMALNARTEILAQSGPPGPPQPAPTAAATECSTLVEIAGPSGTALSGQTWDWHEELAGGWHTQEARGDRASFVGLCEYGMLAKIGVNSRGLGSHFNLLRHASDVEGIDATTAGGAPRGGVPVHLLARAVLGQAATVSEAIEIIRSATVAASTVVTVVTAHDAASVEISPEGVGVIRPESGWLVHTNHFLDPALARGEAVGWGVTTTFEREKLIRERVAEVERPLDTTGLSELLCAHVEDGCAVCRHPEPDAIFGWRTATLATVTLDAASRRAIVDDGGPCNAGHGRGLVAA